MKTRILLYLLLIGNINLYSQNLFFLGCKNRIVLNFNVSKSYNIQFDNAKILGIDSNQIWFEPLKSKPRLCIKDKDVKLIDTILRVLIVPMQDLNIYYGSSLIHSPTQKKENIYLEDSISQNANIILKPYSWNLIFKEQYKEDSSFIPKKVQVFINKKYKHDLGSKNIPLKSIKSIHIQIEGFYRKKYDGSIENYPEELNYILTIKVTKENNKYIFELM